ncbi:hypothetical protein NQ317_010665 [Molorchus minor]|uniref:Cyclic nucleotide-binding domain-containing protein n=1 Tax=Molorchus minor TaxID=1323400 RepID=A0ABQ9K5Q6_9CUCU|nr:hypothetical protein NQ317_010665 [Molorchus minor]
MTAVIHEGDVCDTSRRKRLNFGMICHLEDGAHFGEVALIIKDTFRIASVVAIEVSEIYRLDQKDFVKAINPYPDLLANIQHIAAERMEVASMLDDYNRREQAMRNGASGGGSILGPPRALGPER